MMCDSKLYLVRFRPRYRERIQPSDSWRIMPKSSEFRESLQLRVRAFLSGDQHSLLNKIIYYLSGFTSGVWLLGRCNAKKFEFLEHTRRKRPVTKITKLLPDTRALIKAILSRITFRNTKCSSFGMFSPICQIMCCY